MAQERAQGPTVVVDAGNSLAPALPADRAAAPPGAEVEAQRRVKAELVLDAWVLAGIDGVAVGAADWTLGADWLRERLSAKEVPVLAANLTCDGESPFPGGRVVEVGGRAIGLVGVTAGAPAGCVVGEPVDALRRAVAGLGSVDVVVGLLPVDLAGLAAIGTAGVGLDIVLAGGARPPAGGRGGALPTFEVGSRGRSVGVLDLAWLGGDRWLSAGEEDEAAQRVKRNETRLKDVGSRIAGAPDEVARARFEKQQRAYQEQLERDRALLAGLATAGGNRVAKREFSLGAEVADHPATGSLVAAAKEKIVTTVPVGDPLAVPHRVPPGSAWAGSDTCAGCHRAQHAQWAGTPHAHALGTLVGVQRAADEACWGCHVTGAKQDGGPTTAAAIGPFRDVQCEACHGPSAAHVANSAGVKPIREPDVATCTACHDGDRDQGRFDAATYLPKVRHVTGGAPGSATGAPPPPSGE